MARVKILMNNGSIKSVEKIHARALVHCKKAVYLKEYENKMVSSDDYLKKELNPEKSNKLSFSLEDELVSIRSAYQEKMGKKPFHGWSIEQIKQKMEESE